MPDYKKLLRKKGVQKRSTRGWTKWRGLLSGLILMLIVGALLFSAAVWGWRVLVAESGLFRLKEVSVLDVTGKPVAHPQDFFRRQPNESLNLFSLNMAKIAQDIQARHPQLRKVYLQKRFPDRLLITVEPRVPVAVIVARNAYLVDAEAVILPLMSGYTDLPKITGVLSTQTQLYTKSQSSGVELALNLLKELKLARVLRKYQVLRIDCRQSQDLVFFLENGIEVKMGQDDLKRKAILLSGILAELKAKGAVPEYIDMRFGNPVVMP